MSPPVTVNGIDYTLGRIIYGGGRDGDPEYPYRMMEAVRDFLDAQQVQTPIEIFSDWLNVGHIDEFMTFVPAPTPKGFKLLLASPDICYDILKQLRERGHSEARLREGKELSGESVAISVSAILNNTDLKKQNDRFQEFINWNRDKLKQELGLTEDDIIDLPALFEEGRKRRADAFFPNIVNMIVLNQHLGIPKPYGPKVDGECQFEAYVRQLLEPLDLICHFIDDWEPYFREFGEIHCGTNTRRRPFTRKWWEIQLTGSSLHQDF